jgi:hypothetical protein
MQPITPELVEEMYAALFRIVRQNVLGQAIGHDAMVQARSVIRRVSPDAYRNLVTRRKKAGLPDRPEDEAVQGPACGGCGAPSLTGCACG